MKKFAATVIILWAALVSAAFAPFFTPAITIVSSASGCGSLDSATTALVARMTSTPNCARQNVINNLIVSLKTAGVWAKLDALYLFAAHDSQAALLNWTSASYNATLTNSPTFATDRGFTGNGSNAYITTNFNPTTAVSPKFIQNSAHISTWSRTAGTSSAYDFGGDNASSRVRGLIRSASNNSSYQLNSFTLSSTTGGIVTDGTGQFLINRDTSTNQTWYRNGSSVASATAGATSVLSETFVFLRNASSYSSRELAFGSIGSSLTSTEITDFYTALQTYMTAVGAYP